MKKRIVLLSLIMVLIAGALALCLLYLQPKEDNAPLISTQKADGDFSNLFRLADRRGDVLASVTVTSVNEVTDVIEKYQVVDTLYTKVTVTVNEEFTDRLQDKGALTVMLLGNHENFPDREQLKEGNTYLLRLESWVHESGVIYLLNPLESTYLRIFDGNILVREKADLPNYRKTMTPEKFSLALAQYRLENPVDEQVMEKHYQEIIETLEGYDYQNKSLAYRPDQTAIEKRLSLAKQLGK